MCLPIIHRLRDIRFSVFSGPAWENLCAEREVKEHVTAHTTHRCLPKSELRNCGQMSSTTGFTKLDTTTKYQVPLPGTSATIAGGQNRSSKPRARAEAGGDGRERRIQKRHCPKIKNRTVWRPGGIPQLVVLAFTLGRHGFEPEVAAFLCIIFLASLCARDPLAVAARWTFCNTVP